ncbi:hypothetical protein HZH66_002397 [Vespula vulgaris]|uniref:Uncharacterized protein n=1 Tax=Vespula vulgaris TaxID=7454 RepID=A0A834KJM4_VESVU|nr:hypothetical protein HZH66_002397 [Vespula vulgaris]
MYYKIVLESPETQKNDINLQNLVVPQNIRELTLEHPMIQDCYYVKHGRSKEKSGVKGTNSFVKTRGHNMTRSRPQLVNSRVPGKLGHRNKA